MDKGLKLTELDEGTMYKCKLSGYNMLVVMTRKQDGQEESSDKDEKGDPIMVPTFVDVHAGKFIQGKGDAKQFIFNELHDGQLVELKQ